MKLPLDRALDHPYAITVYGDYIYWTDWSPQGIMRASKNGTGHVEDMRLHVGSVRDIHAFAPDRQNGMSY